MIYLLAFTECVLLLVLCWKVELYERPAFFLYIFIAAASAISYSSTDEAQWLRIAAVSDIARGLLIAESFWLAWRGIAGKWWALTVGLGAGALVGFVLKELDWRFGSGIHSHAIWSAVTFGMWLALALMSSRFALVDWYALILLAWLSIAPAGDLAYWHTHGTVLNDTVNQWATGLRAFLVCCWLVNESRNQVQDANRHGAHSSANRQTA